MGIWYTTREAVKAALDLAETSRSDAQVDRLIDSASRRVESLCHRRFYPERDTRSFAWPSDQMGRSWRFWLDQHELISVETLTSGGTTIASSDYFLEPQASGPPYTRLELDLASSASFGGGDTPQRDLTILGVFGYSGDTRDGGTLATSASSSVGTLDVTDGAAVGVGDLLLIGTEYVQVTGRRQLDTGQTLAAALTASKAATTVTVQDGAEFAPGETVLVDGERMLVTDVAGDNLVVVRAWDGTTLAAHELAATVYAPRTLVVERGVLGTTAAAHDAAATIGVHEVPGPVASYVLADAVFHLQQEQAGYGRSIGSGDTARQVSGRGLAELRAEVRASHGRKARKRVV